jgi:hypothetical protein
MDKTKEDIILTIKKLEARQMFLENGLDKNWAEIQKTKKDLQTTTNDLTKTLQASIRMAKTIAEIVRGANIQREVIKIQESRIESLEDAFMAHNHPQKRKKQ